MSLQRSHRRLGFAKLVLDDRAPRVGYPCNAMERREYPASEGVGRAMSLTRAFPLFGLASSLALACSSGGGGGGSSAAEYAQRYCALLAPCCAELGVPSEMNACRTPGSVG